MNSKEKLNFREQLHNCLCCCYYYFRFINTIMFPSIHFLTFIQFSVAGGGGLEPVPAAVGREVEYTRDGLPGCSRAIRNKQLLKATFTPYGHFIITI